MRQCPLSQRTILIKYVVHDENRDIGRHVVKYCGMNFLVATIMYYHSFVDGNLSSLTFYAFNFLQICLHVLQQSHMIRDHHAKRLIEICWVFFIYRCGTNLISEKSTLTIVYLYAMTYL